MVLPKCKDRAKPPRFSIYKLIRGKKIIYIYVTEKANTEIRQGESQNITRKKKHKIIDQ